MRTSETINELAAALAAAQGEMSNAAFDAVNPHFRSKYATLAAIRDATVPALSKHGLSLLQVTELVTEADMLLTTRLMHSSGQWIESHYPIPIVDKPHIMGSALTYAKRYSWGAICGISSEEDEDGNAAQGNGNGGPPPPKRTREQISADANRKRQEVRDVEKDVQQIDSLRALDRYAQEVLTPDFMASLGMKQWAVEEYMGKRRRELEYAEEEQQSGLYQKATPEQIGKFKELIEWLDGAQDAAELKHRATNDGYSNGFRLMTRQQQDTLRAHYTMRLDGFKAAAAQ